jgi:hypothetical protein
MQTLYQPVDVSLSRAMSGLERYTAKSPPSPSSTSRTWSWNAVRRCPAQRRGPRPVAPVGLDENTDGPVERGEVAVGVETGEAVSHHGPRLPFSSLGRTRSRHHNAAVGMCAARDGERNGPARVACRVHDGPSARHAASSSNPIGGGAGYVGR